ncbi:MAG: class I SAM-dependent methyltransferase [Lachnospiraceae bacterium]|nr:class I SAM-dependent methyltransferase [Lachnospiraceae bacterium]
MEAVTIRKNVDTYMEELRKWAEHSKEKCLEEMTEFFRVRVDGYEEHMSVWQEAYEYLAGLVPEDAKTMLDIGCGTGLELDEILKKIPGLEVTGIDLSQVMLTKLKDKHPENNVKVRQGDYFKENFGKACYDVAVSFETLHHFTAEKKEVVFRKLYDSLKEGGVYVQADYLACCQEEETLLFSICREKRRKEEIRDDVFVHFDTPLTPEHEMACIRNAGFRDVELNACINGAAIIIARK